MPQTLTTTTLKKKRVDPSEFVWLADNHSPGLRVRISNSNMQSRKVSLVPKSRPFALVHQLLVRHIVGAAKDEKVDDPLTH